MNNERFGGHLGTTKDLTFTQQLVLLKDLTERFQALHEAQKMQLQLWPFTVDPTIERSMAEVDFDSKTVTFYWMNSKKKIDKKYQERLNALGRNIKDVLLGSSWNTIVILDNKTIYNSVDTNVKGTRKKTRRGSSRSRTRRGRASRRKS
jgi:hypothetical protein